MELLGVLVPLAVLFLLCAALTLRGGVPAALAPLVGIASLVTWLTLAGMAGFLLPGLVIGWAGSAALGVWALATRRGEWKKLFSPGSVLFWGLALAFAVYFFIRQPMLTQFDELNLWGPAVKVMAHTGRLYSEVDTGTPWAVTQNPGLPLLAYCFNVIGRFADWKIYLAYDVLSFAVYAAVLGNLRWRQYQLAVPLAAILWCVPFFFTTYNHTIYLNTAYLSAYGDIPAGLVLGGAVAVWLALRQRGRAAWAVLPVLALAANLKANTFVLSLVAAGLVAVDAWLFPREKPFTHNLVRRTAFAAGCFAAPLSLYILWNVRYVGRIVARNAEAGGLGETTASLSDIVVNGLKILLGQPVTGFFAEREPVFRAAIAAMGHQFWSYDGRLSMIGQGVRVVALILAVFAVAFITACGRRAKLRAGCLAFFSTLCFVGYNLMLALSYGFIFKVEQAGDLTDYNRYIYSYYIGWFVLALACLALSLQPVEERTVTAKADGPSASLTIRRPWLGWAGRGVVLALAAAMLLRQNQMVLPQLSVLGFSDSEFTDRKNAQAEAALVTEALEPGDRIFFISQGDDGKHWFSAVFDFYPVAVDYSGTVIDGVMNGGGGTFGLPELADTVTGTQARYYRAYTAQQLADCVRDNGCTVLYLQKLDETFVESYQELFTDGLAAALAGETLVYRVTPAGFAPLAMERGAVS